MILIFKILLKHFFKNKNVVAVNNMDISVKVQLQKNNSGDLPIEIVKNVSLYLYLFIYILYFICNFI